jgi:hypothetical protein
MYETEIQTLHVSDKLVRLIETDTMSGDRGEESVLGI